MSQPCGSVFLDRDGVLNIPLAREGKGYAPRLLSEFRLYPDATDSVSRLIQRNWLVFVVTNQPDVGSGLIARDELDTMHDFLRSHVPVNGVFVCPHIASDGCECRKPKAGLILKASEDLGFETDTRWMVGDRDSDIEAGIAVDCTTIFIDRQWWGESGSKANFRVASLAEAVDVILSLQTQGAS